MTLLNKLKSFADTSLPSLHEDCPLFQVCQWDRRKIYDNNSSKVILSKNSERQEDILNENTLAEEASTVKLRARRALMLYQFTFTEWHEANQYYNCTISLVWIVYSSLKL